VKNKKAGGITMENILYGRLGELNFAGVIENIKDFCEVACTTELGHRTAAVFRVCCDAQDKEVYDFDVSFYLGDRSNAGQPAVVDFPKTTAAKAHIGMVGRRYGAGTKEHLRAKRMEVKYSDFIAFTPDRTALLVHNKPRKKFDFLITLRLRDLYSLRANNITERVDSCFSSFDEIMVKLDKKWFWTRRLIALASLECLLRANGLWDNENVRDECRSEAALLLMREYDLSSNLSDGLDEYNLYLCDAQQRLKDSELLFTCAHWLADGGSELAHSLRAADLSAKALSEWKLILENDLGVVLPSLAKKKVQRPRQLPAEENRRIYRKG
jgi:hypothetical protein